MVISEFAERYPSKVAGLVYLAAFISKHGSNADVAAEAAKQSNYSPGKRDPTDKKRLILDLVTPVLRLDKSNVPERLT